MKGEMEQEDGKIWGLFGSRLGGVYCDYRLDMVAEGALVVEIKRVEQLLPACSCALRRWLEAFSSAFTMKARNMLHRGACCAVLSDFIRHRHW
jgi:hypothetical protein